MKICIVSSTRADFGLLKNLILKIKKNNVNYKLIVIGSHLSKYYGSTVSEIKKSDIKISKKVEYKIDTSSEIGISRIISQCTKNITKIFLNLNPDLIILLGDRYEILSCAVSAHVCRIPIAHIHGGELTQGLIDDAFRHSITKLSQLHFVANKIYKKRVIQLGENPKNVFNVGGLGVESIKNTKFLNKKHLEKKLKIQFKKKNIIVNFHPETLKKGLAKMQINEVLKALRTLKETCIIFTMPGVEVENIIIINKIKKFVKENKNSYFFKSLGQNNYFSVLNIIDLMIGNSSSGLLEMPTFKKATINLGERQSGRIKAKSVISTKIKSSHIIKAINKVYTNNFQKKLKNSVNPYGTGQTSEKIFKVLRKINFKNLINKKFYDL